MNSNTDKTPKQGVGLPFSQSVARRIIEDLFREKPQWRSSDLIQRVVQVHQERGGFTPAEPRHMIKRAVHELEANGLLSRPALGWLRSTSVLEDASPLAQESAEPAPVPIADEIEDFEGVIRPEKEVGVGNECVYLYFNPNDRRLAELEGRDVWECKIGRTSNADATTRILSQGIRTALSRLPTLGLIIRTDDSLALEKALHSSFRLIGAEVPDSPGDEWFLTSPSRVEAWYTSFDGALAAIRLHEKKA
jgi:T5orf172 domain